MFVNSTGSQSTSVTSGIPQGSVLGPTLFIIYINDLPNIVQSNVFLFADDTKIFQRIATVNDMELLQRDLDALCEWSKKWLLLFHPDKCKILSLGRNILETSYTMKDTDDNIVNLQRTREEKDLGVIIDEELTFEKHISEKVNLANRNMGIRRTFQIGRASCRERV